MKITIKTDQKIIDLEEDVNLIELTEILKSAFVE